MLRSLRNTRRAYSSSTVKPPKRGILSKTWTGLKWTTGFAVAAGIGYTGVALWRINNPPEQLPMPENKKRLVILGTGWGSVSLLKSLDTSQYEVTVVSPRNYFMFTPLLTSISTGNVENRSIMEPIRHIMRFKQALCTYIEGSVTEIDSQHNRIIVQSADKELGSAAAFQEIPYDELVVGVGSEVSTYGIPGVQEHACFMKEIEHAQQTRKRIMDCIEAASFPGIDEETRKRLLHTVVVGGGPTGVEFAGELHDFFEEDLKKLLPTLAPDMKVTLVEALPNVLPSFSKRLINFTEKHLSDESIQLLTKTAVKRVTETEVTAERTLANGTKETVTLPYGTFVWCGGNMPRDIVKNLISQVPEQGKSGARRGLVIDDYMKVKGTSNIYAIGDCAQSHFAPTAQVAAQQGSYLGTHLNQLSKVADARTKVAELERELSVTPTDDLSRTLRNAKRHLTRISDSSKPFIYSHQGSLAYIGSEQAVADLTFWGNSEFNTGGRMTYLFWRSAYLSMCFSFRNKALVLADWIKVKCFGRDVSRE